MSFDFLFVIFQVNILIYMMMAMAVVFALSFKVIYGQCLIFYYDKNYHWSA